MPRSTRYPRLFSPLRVGPVTVANRIVFSAHLTNYADDGLPSAQHAAYYAARAAGGTGLIITEEHSTHPTDWPYEKLIHAFRPDVVPGYRAITEAVHRHGTPIFAQVNHNGGQGSGLYSRLPVWAPSPLADPLFREVPKEVDRHDIAEIVAGYATVASHCRSGGFDGIELQCSHSSIVRGFLSPATNVRTDAYGGSLPHRARLLLELTAAVREAIGSDLALGVRLCGDELVEGGSTIEDAVEVARMVEAQGLTDYINTSIGVATASLYMIEASMHVPPGYALFVPSAIGRAVRLPVVGAGRFKDPVQAERALAQGHCDLVGVVRGQIADPDFAAKARGGHADDIRLCLSCNQECVGRMGLNRWLGCIEAPSTGQEAAGGRRGPAPDPALLSPTVGVPAPLLGVSPPRPGRHRRRKRVVVVGAGPGGLQAALAAAGNGHEVVVLERQGRPGGQVRLAAAVPSRAELGDLIRNQVHACTRSGVEVRYGVEADVGTVVAERPDAVVVATGAEPARPPWAPPGCWLGAPDPNCAVELDTKVSAYGQTCPQVVDVTHVLDGRASPAGRVLVVDELGFHQATSVAELLAERGCEVEVVTPGMVVGQDLGATLDLEHWNVRAGAKGIRQTTELVPMGVEDGAVSLLHHPSGRTERRAVDWVVAASPPAPAASLFFDLRAQGVPAERVGDCVAPRRAHAAVIEGERAGAAL
ncbi:MAG: FAD-dependent oxidoreductase [Acidimicrobiales bacterium]